MPTFDSPFQYPESKPFKCSAAWHLRRSGLWLAIYDLIGGVTVGGKTPFFASIKKVNDYFGASYETTRRVFKKMVRQGWLRKGGDGHLYYVPHDVRAKKYPEECHKRNLLSWQNDTDPIVGKIYAVTGGKLRLQENMVAWLKKFIKSEEDMHEFLAALTAAMSEAQQKRDAKNYSGTSPKSVFFRVGKQFKDRVEAEVLV